MAPILSQQGFGGKRFLQPVGQRTSERVGHLNSAGKCKCCRVTDWEQHYREGNTPWDKGEPSPGLLDFLAENSMGGAVLVPGCGYGHDVRAIAVCRGVEEVVGLDVAASAVRWASERNGLAGVRYEWGDLFDLPGHLRGQFDWIWEHTCFCAIDPSRRDEYVGAVHGALREGGRFLGVFYLNPYDEEHREGGPPFGASREEIESRFAGRFEMERAWVPQRAYPGREGREWMALMRKRNPEGEK